MWIDIESMGGSTLEAMAGAVENARVVLMCLSQKYKLSPSCRSGQSKLVIVLIVLAMVVLLFYQRPSPSRVEAADHSCV